MLEASKKQVPLKSYSLEIRIDSASQILNNKENRNISMLTRIEDWQILCVYIHFYQITIDVTLMTEDIFRVCL